jgi:hypothetical protein
MKKKRLIIPIILLLIGSVGCEKENKQTQDKIIYDNISKLIVVPNNDSIDGICRNLIFKIVSEDDVDLTAILTTNNTYTLCDGYNSIITNINSSNVSALQKDAKIDKSSHWERVKELNLKNFAGRGERFIGYRRCEYPNGNSEFYYGWIKIKLSIKKDSLLIISRAINYSSDKIILTGQK